MSASLKEIDAGSPSGVHDAAAVAPCARGYSEPERPPVFWLLGIPLDPIDEPLAMRCVDVAVGLKRQLVLVTANVNFLSVASSDRQFHQALLKADLSVADGMPLVWLGRWLGIRGLTRVAGSSLVDRFIARREGREVRAFFLGGENGVASKACERVAESAGDLKVAGWLDPGSGDVEELSTPQIIADVNSTAPDLLVVALGASKGHRWIERNRAALTVPVISHLGATVAFIAGTLKRSPGWLQRLGFEWLWRTYQRPALASRYWRDGLFLLGELLTAVVPLLSWRAFKSLTRSDARISVTTDGRARVEVRGAITHRTLHELRSAIASLPSDSEPVIRLVDVSDLDSAALGYFYELRYRLRGRRPARVVGRGALLTYLLRWQRAGVLVDPPTEDASLSERPQATQIVPS